MSYPFEKNTVTLGDVLPCVQACLALDETPLLMGQPGLGKTSLIEQIAAANGLAVKVLIGSTIDAVDLRGLPSVDGDSASYVPFLDLLPCVERDGPRGILFLDELGQCEPLVQSGLMQLVLDGRVGSYVLPDGWHIVCASNYPGDKAGARAINSALLDRVEVFDVVADLDSWCDYMLRKGYPVELVAFMRLSGHEVLHSFDPARPKNATPRGWEAVARIMQANLPRDVERRMVTARVGEAPQVMLNAFRATFRDLPNVDACLKNPAGADIPTKSDVLCAFSGAIAARANAENLGAVVDLTLRLPPEYQVSTLNDIQSRDDALCHHPDMSRALVAVSEFIV